MEKWKSREKDESMREGLDSRREELERDWDERVRWASERLEEANWELRKEQALQALDEATWDIRKERARKRLREAEWEIGRQEALKWLEESNWEDRVNEALEWLREENRKDREAEALERLEEPDWEDRYSDAREWLKEQLNEERLRESADSRLEEATWDIAEGIEQVRFRDGKVIVETSVDVAEILGEEITQEIRGLWEISDERVRDAFAGLESKEWDRGRLSEGLKQLGNDCQEPGRALHCDIRRSLELTRKELGLFEAAFRETREALDRSGEVRFGMIGENLYVWKPDLDSIRLENAYGDLYYYFRDKDAFESYIADVGESLGLEGQEKKEVIKHLRELASQMVTEPSMESCINSHLERIRGDYVHLINDLSGERLSDLEVEISKITKKSGRGGIENPRFPQGEELEIALARLAATAVSDCHLKANGTLEYSEKEMSRIRIFEKDLQVFGDISLNPRRRKGENLYEAYLPTPLGIMLQHLGIPSGDRTVQNPGLFPEIKEFSIRAQCAFIEDLVPQDGTISRKRVQWTHTNVLHAGDKTGTYGITPKIGIHEIDLIKEKGKREQHSWVMTYGRLRELQKSESRELQDVARNLWESVYENPNRLIQDEVEIVRSFGIKYIEKPYAIRYHERSGRVSVAWTAEPSELIDSMKLAMIAPSNDEIKQRIMKDLIANHPEYVVAAKKQFEDLGIDVHEWWMV
jgi:hypothetical protein